MSGESPAGPSPGVPVGAPSADRLGLLGSMLQRGETHGRAYTGVGSRETPAPVQALMRAFAQRLEVAGWTLRSGAADGADAAFEAGVVSVHNKQIFLPYPGFRRHPSGLSKILSACFEIAEKVHPKWEACSDFARKAHARNVFQVLGYNLRSPTAFVACWTKDGAVDAASARNAGGTRTAIVLAAEHGIPVLNLARPDHRAALEQWLGVEPGAAQGSNFALDLGTPRAPRAP